MLKTAARLLVALAIASLSLPAPLGATDVDGPDDCQRLPQDFGDAPEGTLAYPGVLGRFPTCVAAGAVGTREAVCTPRSSVPGATGFVRHVAPSGILPYWLGCTAAASLGIDSESDGKVNDTGAALSACGSIAIDCVEAAFGLSFGQDECAGGNDAGLLSARSFVACSVQTLTIGVKNCATFQRQIYLNVLLDMNSDGDWNDSFVCGALCAHEWAVKNVAIVLPFGCSSITSPAFRVGPVGPLGQGWLRISISDAPVSDDFPWNGSIGEPNQRLVGGETEDYPVMIRADACSGFFRDHGDAPEGIAAYSSGTLGRFPTCEYPFGGAGGVIDDCYTSAIWPIEPAGFVRHVTASSRDHFWLGCGLPGQLELGRDMELDGKVSVDPLMGMASACATGVFVDCFEASWLTFGQDECYGSPDAALASPVTFTACRDTTLRFTAYSCGPNTINARLNLLVDWDGEGDWLDVARCPDSPDSCVPEWVVKNLPVALAPGCNTLTVPVRPAARTGEAWMRITLTPGPVSDHFPWYGSAFVPGGEFDGGETEDYPVYIAGSLLGVSPGLSSGLAFAPLTPNPSRTGTVARFTLPRDGDVSLDAYDVTGRAVRVLARGALAAGAHVFAWDLRDDEGQAVPAGLYLVKLRVGADTITRRVIRLK